MEDTVDALNDPSCLSKDEERRRFVLAPTRAEAYIQLGSTIMDWAERGILDYLIDVTDDEFDRSKTFSLIATPVLPKGQWSEDFTRINIQNAFGIFSYGELKGPRGGVRENEILDDYCRGLTVEPVSYTHLDVYKRQR